MKRNLKRKLRVAGEVVAAGALPTLTNLNDWRRWPMRPRRWTKKLNGRQIASLAAQVPK